MHSKKNPCRSFDGSKPHKWGTKLFMACDTETAYMHRFEVYVGKRQSHETVAEGKAHMTGPAAVTRNLKIMIAAQPTTCWRVVAMDRFYSAPVLAIQLLAMKIYMVGTVQVNRVGFNKAIARSGDRPASIARGTFNLSRSLDIPTMSSLCWWDNKAVNFLATGCAMSKSHVMRRNGGPLEETPCPSAVRDYHKWMGGVDIHNQLRLQRYSIQMSVKFLKYYKTVFFGLVDLAVTNAYITFKWHAKKQGKPAMVRADFMTVLHKQLLQMKAEDFADAQPSPAVFGVNKRKRAVVGHALQLMEDWKGKSICC